MQLVEERLGTTQDTSVIDERSANYLYYLAGGHPGIIGFLLANMKENAKNYRSNGITTLHRQI